MSCCGCCSHEFGSDHLLNIRPYKDRVCTDLPFLGLFIAFLGLMGFVAMQAVALGDPTSIAYAVNMDGLTCGVSPGVKDKPFGAWPYPLLYEPKICVASCSDTSDLNSDYMAIPHPTVEFMGAYCLPNVTAVLAIVSEMGSLGVSSIANGTVDFNSASEMARRAVSDVYTARTIVGLSIFIALAAAFAYIFILKYAAGAIVWLMIMISVIFAIVCSVGVYMASITAADSMSPDTAKFLQYISYVLFTLTGLYILLILFLRKRINIAVEVVKEASRALQDIPTMVCFPVFPLFYLVGLLSFWVIIALYIYSVADSVEGIAPDEVKFNFLKLDLSTLNLTSAGTTYDPTDISTYPFAPTLNPGSDLNSDPYITLEWNQQFKKYFAVHFFGLLWNVQFVIYFSYMVMAGATAHWYFTPRNDASRAALQAATANFAKKEGWTKDHLNEMSDFKLSKTPLKDAVIRTCRFHLGSVAFASLLIAIVEFARAVIHYVEHVTKKKTNRVQKAIFCCIKCCLRCVECCLDKISKNALIWIAVFGTNFASAACDSFSMLFQNMARVAAINMVSSYLLFIGKVLVMFATGCMGAYILSNAEPYKSELSSIALPVLIMLFIGYAVGQLFMIVYDNIIDTIFLCFLMDESRNKGKEGGMLASESLQELVNKNFIKQQAMANYKAGGKVAPAEVEMTGTSAAKYEKK